MKHLVYLAIAAGALAMTGCGRAAPPKPADPLAAAPAPTPAAEYSCGDGYIFDTDQLPGPEGAVVNDVFYWGSSTSGAARCFSDTRNDSIIGRVESNAGDATGAVVLSVTLPDGPRWYFILQFPDGTYCSAATAGDGRATCFATVERDATGFRLDDLPADPLPVPTGAPEPPVENPGPGGGDEGGGHTGAPEPEEPTAPATSSQPCPNPVPESYRPEAGWGGQLRDGETLLACTTITLTIGQISLGIYPPDHGSGEPSLHPYAYRMIAATDSEISTTSSYVHPPGMRGFPVTFSISIPEFSLTSEGTTFKLSAGGSLSGVWALGPVRSNFRKVNPTLVFECSEPGQSGECATDEQGNPLYPHGDAWRSLAGSQYTVYCRWSITTGTWNTDFFYGRWVGSSYPTNIACG